MSTVKYRGRINNYHDEDMRKAYAEWEALSQSAASLWDGYFNEDAGQGVIRLEECNVILDSFPSVDAVDALASTIGLRTANNFVRLSLWKPIGAGYGTVIECDATGTRDGDAVALLRMVIREKRRRAGE